MQKPYRRFELLLPTRHNSGAVSSETQRIEGRWRHQGELYRDESIRVFCDVPDTAENLQFFVDFKERLKARFQQIDIWMTTYPLEVI
jgi:hypothetical protein